MALYTVWLYTAQNKIKIKRQMAIRGLKDDSGMALAGFWGGVSHA